MAEQNLDAIAFPKLDESQIAQLSRCAEVTLERYEAGRKLFEVGDRDYRFFVIKSGEVESPATRRRPWRSTGPENSRARSGSSPAAPPS